MRSAPARGLGVTCLAAVLATVAGCRQGPVAPDNGLVEIANLSNAGATFHWQSPGLFGTAILGGSGDEPIGPCSGYARGFAPGDQRLTVTTSVETKSFTLAAPSSGQAVLWVVIGADGTIRETTASEAPASPYCPG